MRIGNVTIEGFAALAPMAGTADRAMREICRGLGACYTVSEMVSAKGVSMGGSKSAALLETDAGRPFGVQLFGADPDCVRAAAEEAAARGPDIIDLNMGCPAPKITGGAAGSALLKNLPLAGEIARAAVAGAGKIPVTAKIRKGFGPQDDVAVEAARRLEQAGVAAVAVHGRTRAQMYAPPVDLDCIARVKRAVGVPVIGNGDIFSAADAVRMFRQTGCDLVMVGRGAMGNPWIFLQINAAMRNEAPPAPPTVEERLAVMRRELSLLLADKGEHTGLREARKHAAWYMTGLRGAAQLRRMCASISSLQDIERICGQALAFHCEKAAEPQGPLPRGEQT